jgi:hypothetical protein
MLAAAWMSAAQLITIDVSLAQQAPANIPCDTENHRAFDFWLGNWEVSLPDGSVAGFNSITAIQGGCVLKEEWRSSTSGYTGTSYNFYDSKTKQWRQVWLDNQGGLLDMAGDKKDNQMIMRTSSQANTEGLDTFHQITWAENNDGSVRQLWETFTDGQAVVVAFDGLYVKANNSH